MVFLSMISLSLQGQQVLPPQQEKASPETKYIEAKKLQMIGQLDRAIEAFEALYKEDRQNDVVAFDLARAYDVKGDVLLTRKYIESALKNKPENVWYNDFYATFLLKADEYRTAITPLDLLIAANPLEIKYYDMAIEASIGLKDKALGQKYLDQLKNKFGTSERVLTRMFEYFDVSNDERALNTANDLIAKYPNDKNYLKLKARWLNQHNRKAEAIAVFKEVLVLDPNDTDANLVVLETTNKTDEKGNAYLRSLLPIIKNSNIDIDNKVKELIPFLKEMALNNDTSLVAALLELGKKLTLTHPKEAKAHAFYADVLYNAGQDQNAIAQYEKTLTLDDTNFKVWEQLLALCSTLDLKEKSLKYSYAAYDLFPNQASAYLYYAKSLISDNKMDDAIEILNEGGLVAAGNKVVQSKMETAKAQAYLKGSKFEQAKAAVDKALTLSENKNALAYEVLGDYFYLTNKPEDAKNAYLKSQTLGNVGIKEKLFMRGIH